MKNDQNYAGLQQIQDRATHEAVRILHDRINSLSTTVRGPQEGTINPDQKPRGLTRSDAGFIFHATDFNRNYRWNGSGWEDAPGAPSRNSVLFFVNDPVPPTGWVQCNGDRALRSTPEGRTEVFQAPLVSDREGQQAWIRV